MKRHHVVTRTEDQATAAGLHINLDDVVTVQVHIFEKAFDLSELKEDVLPCPACGWDVYGDDINAWCIIEEPCCKEEGDGEVFYKVMCENAGCGMQGPHSKKDVHTAVSMWNALPRERKKPK